MNKVAEAALADAVGKTIARKRVEAGFTQEQVAEKLGLQREAVARVERGTAIPTVVRLAELAELFGCPTGELLMESSTVTVDQAAEVVKMLGRVPLADRQLLVRWLGEFADRLSLGK
ncbi:helix-turn-helix domain-containing protein [Paraburkholderia flava]|uniref:helix-turn-helix domain-containing protein n=1 Tax=Paraburkholderia flava TaxID=2547393 RepID=UPI00105C9C03|nr:helix-turn-helix transcriptional regulator [Paraburkholderia flava]